MIRFASLLMALLLAAPLSATAQHAGHASPPAAAGAAVTPALVDAEVRRIDTAAGKITLRHGAIANLDMPPMTMVFTVADRAWLDAVKVGDKVRFTTERRDGAMVVTHLERVP